MSNSYSYTFHKLTAFFILIVVFSSNFSAFAQTRKTGASTPKCSGAWTGNITYTKTQAMSDSKTVERVSNRGKDTWNWEMKLDYKASVAVVESPERNGSSIGKATINHTFSNIEKSTAVEENSCDQGKTWRQMYGDFTSESKVSGTGKEEANVGIGVNDDRTYTISVGLPQITGQLTGSESSSYSGQCTKKEGKNTSLPSTQTSIQGNSFSTNGTHRINPSDPNRLSGSYSETIMGVTETITWNLQKCGGELRITDLKFEDMKFPNWNDWQEIVEQKGTIDGNWIRIKAKVLNTSGESKFAEVYFKETYKGDKWDGARKDQPLKNQSFSIRIEPGEEYEVEMLWDSSGYAWFDDGRPRLVQRIKAEVWKNTKKIDEITKNLKIAPKPLVLVHGLWSSWRAWESWQNILTTSHSYNWKAFPVGEKAEHGRMNTGGEFLSTTPTNSIGENARELEKYIEYARKDRNAWHVDIVAHSMGGLISRYYISQIMEKDAGDFRPPVAHLVMLGTPNMGSPCADVMNVVFESLGKNVEAVRQLRQDYAEGFNKINTNRKGVKFSVLAGNPLPTMCKSVVWNDGVVPVPSAKWIIADNAESKSIHTDLTGTSDFSSFVKPHLAIGPGGDHNPATPEMPKTSGQIFVENNGVMFMNAGFQRQSTIQNPKSKTDMPDFAKAVKLTAKKTTEIEIPVEQVTNFGLTFMASPEISATLLNEKGEIVGKNLTKTPEAKAWFRSIFVDKNVSGGTWKLKLENTSDRELEVILATWSDVVK
jgi:pimeloyl-ACP methyl ester carboxylesterase